ncbi:flagellin [Herminiimonas fonticola]|uniref:Flagellin n=1 Tax=Herminiimonas fonticola TaxID=303380 RepID=A0A4R6GKC0_9BURK|nr:flagellin [Herminiimonas fonticola]RBA25812.1 Bacterial flagellin N-terminal helical region [Herminiimonas fonticola]TDN94920.1 flagellin [Herminiimonas fonticola]
MAAVINTNTSSLNAQRNLTTSQSSLATSLQRLSSGLRINSAKDDAAGLAISDRMTSQINGLNRAAQNANDGISMAQTAEGGLGTASDLLQRMRTLAVQSANGTNSASDRASLQEEVSQLQQELNRVANTTQFNGQNILDGSLSNAQFQVGANANQTINFSISSAQATAIGNNTLTAASAGTMVNSTTAAVAFGNNNVAAGTLTIQGNGATSGALTVNAGESAKSLADKVNASSGATNVTASAQTKATLSAFTAGTVSLTLQGAPTSTGANNPVTVSATLASATDVSALAKAINDQTGTTGITAIADLTNGKISLTQSQGYDIKVANGQTSTGTVKVAGAPTTDGGNFTDVTLAIGDGATATATDSTTVGGKVTFNSPTAFTASQSAAGIVTGAGAATLSSQLSSVAQIDITTVANGIPSGANDALQVIDSALANLSSSRASLGALQNRFTSVVASLSTTSENLSAARSRILDADFASETANLTRGQILQQAGTAMLAQANALPNGVLALLRG